MRNSTSYPEITRRDKTINLETVKTEAPQFLPTEREMGKDASSEYMIGMGLGLRNTVLLSNSRIQASLIESFDVSHK